MRLCPLCAAVIAELKDGAEVIVASIFGRPVDGIVAIESEPCRRSGPIDATMERVKDGRVVARYRSLPEKENGSGIPYCDS